MELWRECAGWLLDLKMISYQDPVLKSNAKINDLVSLLRDGSVLCRLVHSVDPTSIDMNRVLFDQSGDSGNVVSNFVCRNNLFVFIYTITNSFGMRYETDLFEPEDLYLCKNMARVLESLSILSHSQKFSGIGVSGFPKEVKHLAKRLRKEKSIYQTLNKSYGEAIPEYIYDTFSRNRRNDNSDVQYEKMYQKIISPKPSSRIPLDLSFSKKSKRESTIRELLTTEETYLANLKMVKNVFRDQLTHMSSYHKGIIFYQLDSLIDFHTEFLRHLTKRNINIGDVFLDKIDYIKDMYGSYCVNLSIATDTLLKLEAGHEELKQQIRECEQNSKPSGFLLVHHIVIPFQRFLKYHILLKNLLGYTSVNSFDYESIKRATIEMERIGHEVNEMKRELEEATNQTVEDRKEIDVIENIGKSIKLMRFPNNSTLCDFGHLRRTGDATVYSDHKKVADYAFVFDMVIVLCQKPKWPRHRYRFREAIRLKEYFLEPLTIPPNEMDRRISCFRVKLLRRSDMRRSPITFIVKTLEERQAWFDAIYLAMEFANPVENEAHRHVLRYSTFTDPLPDCSHCKKKFLGIFFQGYQCLRCQAYLHKSCISQFCCIEIDSFSRTESMSLPMAIPDSMERSDSTLSLSTNPESSMSKSFKNMSSPGIQEMKNNLQEMMNLPLEKQSWFAGNLPGRIANELMESGSVPVGTFLVRQRSNGDYTVMLKTDDPSRLVKAMLIREEMDTMLTVPKMQYSFSEARKFDSIQKLIAFYRNRDLTENFDYPILEGIFLKYPYQDV